MQRLLYQIHRWGGIALALFMFIWFVSGLVIMYAPSSALGPAERLAHRELLKPEAGWLSLGDALQISAPQRLALPAAKERGRDAQNNNAQSNKGEAGASKPLPPDWVVEARLVREFDQPLWLVESGRGQRFALSGLDGKLVDISAEQSVRIAERWLKHDEETTGAAVLPQIRHLDTGPQDSSVRNYETLRPFHRLAVGDGGRELLISAHTGEVVRDSTIFTRALFWAGNWIHLLRPIEAVSPGETRRNTQLWLGFVATLAALTGLIIGWQRWRPGWGGRATYSQGRVHPYRDVWNTWHFWAGLIGGIAATFWALSGYFNTNPGQIFSPANPTKEELTRYQGKQVPPELLAWKPADLAGRGDDQVVELSLRHLGGKPVLLGTTASGTRLPVGGKTGENALSEPELLAAAGRLLEGVPVANAVLQSEYDNYYYPRHHQGAVEKPLPVLHVTLADKADTHLYIDPQDGRLLQKQDTSRRVYRWVYSALHHWDFGWLYHRPIWDVWMLPLVLFGIVLGATSVVLGYKRLQLTFGKKKKPARKAKTEGLLNPLPPKAQET